MFLFCIVVPNILQNLGEVASGIPFINDTLRGIFDHSVSIGTVDFRVDIPSLYFQCLNIHFIDHDVFQTQQ